MGPSRTNSLASQKIRLPYGFLGMIVIVVLIELAITRHDDFTTLASAEHAFAYQAAREAHRYELLCFGDSQTKDAIIPKVLEKRLGRRTLNLSIAGSPAPSSYFLLRRALNSGARPSAILVDFHAWLLQIDPKDRVYMYAELCGIRDSLDLAWTMRDLNFLGALTTTTALPSWKARKAIQTDLTAALQGKSPESVDPHRRLVRQSQRNWLANGGAQVMPRIPDVVKVKEFWDEDASYPEKWTCVPTNLAYVSKFFELASEYDIPVFFLIPPRHPRVQLNRERLGLDALYTAFVREATAGHSNVTVIDGRSTRYDPSLFIDSSHLDRQGACNFSNDVSHSIASRLDTRKGSEPRWIALVSQGKCPEPRDLEDLGESGVALETGDARLRR